MFVRMAEGLLHAIRNARNKRPNFQSPHQMICPAVTAAFLFNRDGRFEGSLFLLTIQLMSTHTKRINLTPKIPRFCSSSALQPLPWFVSRVNYSSRQNFCMRPAFSTKSMRARTDPHVACSHCDRLRKGPSISVRRRQSTAWRQLECRRKGGRKGARILHDILIDVSSKLE